MGSGVRIGSSDSAVFCNWDAFVTEIFLYVFFAHVECKIVTC